MGSKMTYLALTPEEFMKLPQVDRPDGSWERYNIHSPLEWEETASWTGDTSEQRREVRRRKLTRVLVAHTVYTPDPKPAKPAEDE